jgi:hypothetical protein
MLACEGDRRHLMTPGGGGDGATPERAGDGGARAAGTNAAGEGTAGSASGSPSASGAAMGGAPPKALGSESSERAGGSGGQGSGGIDTGSGGLAGSGAGGSGAGSGDEDDDSADGERRYAVVPSVSAADAPSEKERSDTGSEKALSPEDYLGASICHVALAF